MSKAVTKFITAETGAVTVDWVVLTASVVGLGLATMAVVSAGVEDLSGDVETQLSDNTIISARFASGGPGGFSDLAGCGGGVGAINAYAAAQVEAGNWDVAGDGPNYGAFDPGDVEGEITSYYGSTSPEEAQEQVSAWEASYASQGDSMHASDFVEWAIVECIAAGVPLS